MGSEEVADSAVKQAMDQGLKVAEKAGHTVNEGYKAAQQFAEDKGLNLDLGKFVRSEPWLAVAIAFAIGCAVTAVVRRVS
jgi:ElaB/YqjD/DUF883 family membrane-anchored ribosome-binding protein